jgi:hypothetical protein
MKKNHTLVPLLTILIAAWISGCSKEWRNPDAFSPQHKKRYCYQSIGKTICFSEPQKCYENDLTGYIGPPPSRKKIQ